MEYISEPTGTKFWVNGQEWKHVLMNDPQIELRGWLVKKIFDGSWVKVRKATDSDIQAISSAVVAEHHFGGR